MLKGPRRALKKMPTPDIKGNSLSRGGGQSGVALVSMLLLVALATVLASAIVQEQQLVIRAAGTHLDRGQAKQYAIGGEELARQILHQDYLNAPEKDYLGEEWAGQDLSYDFELGGVNLQIIDLQARFNINSLSKENPRNSSSRAFLSNLMEVLFLDTGSVDLFKDWIDEDSNIRPNGMEDFEYLALEPPYRASNSLLSDVSEAALFLDSKTFRTLKPYLVSLPSPSSFLNINTMGAPIIQMLNNELTLEAAESIVIFRDSEEGFDTLEEFLQTPQLAGLSIPRELLSVKSSFYEIRIIARYREQFSYLRSILYRNSSDGSSLILKRDFSKMFDSFLLPSSGGADRGA